MMFTLAQPFDRATWMCFLALLSGLWILICIWFAMICRVVWRVLMGESADDSRSDADEDEVLDLSEEDELDTEHEANILIRFAVCLCALG